MHPCNPQKDPSLSAVPKLVRSAVEQAPWQPAASRQETLKAVDRLLSELRPLLQLDAAHSRVFCLELFRAVLSGLPADAQLSPARTAELSSDFADHLKDSDSKARTEAALALCKLTPVEVPSCTIMVVP
jgi:hypothetical protein